MKLDILKINIDFNGGIELYSKDTFEATRYSITSSPLIVRSGKLKMMKKIRGI